MIIASNDRLMIYLLEILPHGLMLLLFHSPVAPLHRWTLN